MRASPRRTGRKLVAFTVLAIGVVAMAGALASSNSRHDIASASSEPTVIATIPVGNAPAGVAANPTTNRVYVANAADDTVSVIDGATNTVIATVPVGDTPSGVGVNATTNRACVANYYGDSVSVIDGGSNTVVGTVSLDYGYGPHSVGVNLTTNRVYVSDHMVVRATVIDGATNTVLTTILVQGSGPKGVGVNPATDRVYVANRYSGTVSVIDGVTNTVLTTIPGLLWPEGVGVNSATNRVYVSNVAGGSIAVIDGATNTVIGTVPVGGMPGGVAVNVATNRVYVANSSTNDVSVIDGDTNTVTATIPVGAGPAGVAVNPTTNRIYVANSADDTVTVIEDNGGAPPPIVRESRVIVYVQGIGSRSDCGVGFEDRAPEWITPILDPDNPRSLVRGGVSVEGFAYFSYADDYSCPGGMADYSPEDTCAGIGEAAVALKTLIDQVLDPGEKATIVAHSMGGPVAALIAAAQPEWARSKIASVVTFDSPLHGLDEVRAHFAGSPSCEWPDQSKVDLCNDCPENSPNVLIPVWLTAGASVPFYTIDATTPDIDLWGETVEFVPGASTHMQDERLDLPSADTHSSVWDDPSAGKEQFVACAVLAADGCTFDSAEVTQGGTTEMEMAIGPPATRVRFISQFGSTVRMTLISPDGTVYGPDGAGPVAGYAVDAVSEAYEITDPAPGVWTVQLMGVDVAPEGEDVLLTLLVMDSSPAGAVGGIADLPDAHADAAATKSSQSAPNTFAIAGFAAGSALLLVAGAWYSRRRRPGRR